MKKGKINKKKKALIVAGIILLCILFLLFLRTCEGCNTSVTPVDKDITIKNEPDNNSKTKEKTQITSNTKQTPEKDPAPTNEEKGNPPTADSTKEESPPKETVTEDETPGFYPFLEYGGHYYYYFNQKTTWENARKICEAYGGYLVVITDWKENRTVVGALKKLPGFENYWIGLYKEKQKWTWVTGEKYKFTYWVPGEPNNFRGMEKFVQIRQDVSTPDNYFKWNDESKNSLSRFVMERESPLY